MSCEGRSLGLYVWPMPQSQRRLLVHAGSAWVWAPVPEEWSSCLQGLRTLSLPLQSWADGVILHQTFCVEIPKRTFWWFRLSACSPNLHIWSDIRDTLNELQLSSKMLQSDLKGFSQAIPEIHFPLSPWFQGLLENKWLVLFQRDQVSYLVLLFPGKKRKRKQFSSPKTESRANWSSVPPPSHPPLPCRPPHIKQCDDRACVMEVALVADAQTRLQRWRANCWHSWSFLSGLSVLPVWCLVYPGNIKSLWAQLYRVSVCHLAFCLFQTRISPFISQNSRLGLCSLASLSPNTNALNGATSPS